MDEPTGNLDPNNAAAVWALMTELMTELNTSFVVVTHDEQLAKKMDRVLFLTNGKLEAHGI
jgi:lipoprotein-releasing system ATP-binding protein